MGGFIKGNGVAIMGGIFMDGLKTGQGQADVFLAPRVRSTVKSEWGLFINLGAVSKQDEVHFLCSSVIGSRLIET